MRSKLRVMRDGCLKNFLPWCASLCPPRANAGSLVPVRSPGQNCLSAVIQAELPGIRRAPSPPQSPRSAAHQCEVHDAGQS